MAKLIINNYDEFAAYLGKNLGTSDYVELSQERINMFADATLDHQWIHVDTEKAKEESPYKTTIAHGYLTLSMLPYLWNQIIEVNNLKMMVNYGMDKMKFGQAVKSDVDLPVETTCTHKRLVKYVCTVCRGKNNHTAVGTEAIHFSKQLIQGVFPFVIA